MPTGAHANGSDDVVTVVTGSNKFWALPRAQGAMEHTNERQQRVTHSRHWQLHTSRNALQNHYEKQAHVRIYIHTQLNTHPRITPALSTTTTAVKVMTPPMDDLRGAR